MIEKLSDCARLTKDDIANLKSMKRREQKLVGDASDGSPFAVSLLLTMWRDKLELYRKARVYGRSAGELS